MIQRSNKKIIQAHTNQINLMTKLTLQRLTHKSPTAILEKELEVPKVKLGQHRE